MIFNPVILSVTTMIVLSLIKLNVILAILVAALVAGVTSGIGIDGTMKILISGMGGNSEAALSYILLGALAVAINNTGVAALLSKKISKVVSGKKWILALIIAVVTCFSQNVIPVHIAFIPILIPPLLKLMDKLKMDRRSMACSLTFGLKMPYIVLPVGFGLIFHGIIRDQIVSNGMNVELNQVWKVTWILGIAMLIGLLIAVFVTYSKPREYKDLSAIGGIPEEAPEKMEPRHWYTIVAAIIAFGIQLYTGSLPLGAIVALGFMLATKVIKWNEIDSLIGGGIGIMGLIAFIMLVAAGYGNVVRETGAVAPLVQGVSGIVGGSKLMGSLVMLLVGLFITMGIGTSFGTIPILAAIYVPLCMELGISPMGTIVLIACAGALGDAGSPASDSTLGPTAGLDADGQHDHIWDTCVPTFIHYNIPLIIAGVIGGVLF